MGIPLHMVRKADGSWRPCGDYRRLNAATVPDTYPIPNMMDFTTKVAGSKIFSKIDLRKGYHQIPMNPEDIPKTVWGSTYFDVSPSQYIRPFLYCPFFHFFRPK